MSFRFRIFTFLVLLVPFRGYAESSEVSAKKVLDRGAYLTKVAACGACHGENPADPESSLSGGFEIRDSFGKVRVPNITPDKESGIGSWTLPELQHAIRSSLGKNDEYLSVDAHGGYRWMSDEDVNAISQYLLSTKPVSSDIPRRNISSFSARKWGIFSQHEKVKGYVPGVSQNSGGYYGMYLVSHVANCSRCHSPGESSVDSSTFLEGSRGKKFLADPFFDVRPYPKAPNLRNAEGGMIGLTDDDVIRFLSSGKGLTPETGAEYCPTSYYSHMSSRDLNSIIKYLRSLE